MEFGIFLYYCLVKKNGIYITRGRMTVIRLIFPAFCFAFAVYMIYYGFNNASLMEPKDRFGPIFFGVMMAFLLTILGIVSGTVRDHHFDFLRKRYKIVKRVWFIGTGTWKPFRNIEYVSMYRNNDGKYEIKLWYNTNKNFSIEYFRSKKRAVKAGEQMAKDLAIDFYDGTDEQEIIYEDHKVEKIPEEKRRIHVEIYQPKRPFWQLLTATIFYILALLSVVLFIRSVIIAGDEEELIILPQVLEISWLFLIAAFSFSVLRDYKFDFKNNQYKEIYRLGPIRVGKWKKFSSIDYISVFRKREKKIIVNLWYNDNKRIKLAEYRNFNDAMFQGERVARSLKIDLLDAGDPHNTTWVKLD